MFGKTKTLILSSYEKKTNIHHRSENWYFSNCPLILCSISNIRPILGSNISFISGRVGTFHFWSFYTENTIFGNLSLEKQLILRITQSLLRTTHSCRRTSYLNSYWHKKTGTYVILYHHTSVLINISGKTTVLLSSLQVFHNFLVFLIRYFIIIL